MTRPRGGAFALAGSPVLVGATTVLVAIVAVFLSYNSNNGLPFVPTYELKANLPNAANLVRGNEVRIGGARVGAVTEIDPRARADGTGYAQIRMRLDQDLDPLPADSSLIVRPKSALGLKYLELTPGRSKRGLEAGSTMRLRAARPRPVEIDEVLNTFDERTRLGSRGVLNGLGTGLAGRGQDLNAALPELSELLEDLTPVMRNLSSGETQLARFVRALGATAGELAPVAEDQAALFANLDTTFTALASVARPFLQETISESSPTFELATAEFPRQRPFIRNSAAFFRELRPGVRRLPGAAPVLADALEEGVRVLPRTPDFNRRLAHLLDEVAELAEDPNVERGLDHALRLTAALQPLVRFLTPVQTRCNYVSLLFRNVSSLLSEGDSHGTWQRFIIIATPQGPNSESGPSSRPANGGGQTPQANHLHSNPYPNTASPGQPRECEAGNEPYAVGQTVIGNVSGNQGTGTDGQEGGG